MGSAFQRLTDSIRVLRGRATAVEPSSSFPIDQGNRLYRDYIEKDPTVIGWFGEQWPSKQQASEYVVSLFPSTQWVLSYNLQWFYGDLVAGLTVGAIIIPQGMAYAKLAELPVQFGLYSSFFGGLTYWVFGTSCHISVGPAAILATITGLICHDVQRQFPSLELPNHEIASSISLVAGIAVAIIGILRLGFLIDLIPLAGVEAFVTGSALNIAISQVPSLLGLKKIDTQGPVDESLMHIFAKLHEVRGADAAVGISALIILYLIKWGCNFGAARLPRLSKAIFFFATLRTVLIIFIYTLASFVVNHSHKNSPTFAVLGSIPSGFRDVAVPPFSGSLVGAIIPNLPAICIVLLVEHLSVAKSFGRVHNYPVNPSQEILAIGVANIAGSFLGGFPNTGSFSRTAVCAKAGARSPMQGVLSAMLVLIAVYTLMPVFFYVPNAALAGVIIHAVIDMITSPSHVAQYWRISPLDAMLFAVGVFVAVFKGIEPGVYTTVAISLALFLWRSFQAKGSLLGMCEVSTSQNQKTTAIGSQKKDDSGPLLGCQDRNASTRTQFLPFDRRDGLNPTVQLVAPAPGIFVYRFKEGFNYTNANRHLDSLAQSLKRYTRPTTIEECRRPGDRPWNNPVPRFGKKKENSEDDRRPTLKAVILDFSAVGHVDLTSTQALVGLQLELDRHTAPDRAQWHFANVQTRWAKRALAAAGFGTRSTQAESFSPAFAFARSHGDPLSGQDLGKVEFIDTEKGIASSTTLIETAEIREFTKGKPTIVETSDCIEKDLACSGSRSIESGDEGCDIEVMETRNGSSSSGLEMAALYGTNRPCFHVDVYTALECASRNCK